MMPTAPGTPAVEINGGMGGFHDSCAGAEISPMMKFDFRQIVG